MRPKTLIGRFHCSGSKVKDENVFSCLFLKSHNKIQTNLPLEYQLCLVWSFYIAVLHSKLCISLPLQDDPTAGYSHKKTVSECLPSALGLYIHRYGPA